MAHSSGEEALDHETIKYLEWPEIPV